MVPFEQAFDAGVPLVMVGHLRSKGLTGDETPASLSRQAMTYLRARVGDDTVIITDSLSMAATTKALGISCRRRRCGRSRPAPTSRCSPRASRRGHRRRDGGDQVRAAAAGQAEATVLRVLELKRKAGLAP